MHKRVEGAFTTLHVQNIGTLVKVGAPPKCKKVQMAIIFHLLQFGIPIIEFPSMKELLQFLGIHKFKLFHFLSISIAHVIHFVLKHRFG